MGSAFDDFLKDVSAIGKELADAKNDIKSGMKDMLGDVASLKDDVRNTIDGTKNDIHRTKRELHDSLKIFPDEPSENTAENTQVAQSKVIDVIGPEPKLPKKPKPSDEKL